MLNKIKILRSSHDCLSFVLILVGAFQLVYACVWDVQQSFKIFWCFASGKLYVKLNNDDQKDGRKNAQRELNLPFAKGECSEWPKALHSHY